ncbi:MAG: cysteine--tRNA ligase [Candidatus Buchananbacteria bacterium]|nr:cysteine--tRNA ligase [Candidatus Buchananbacteria bacterium]
MLQVYNTLVKKKEDFKPIKDKSVSFYQCGPTVYFIQHIGNMRAMVLADLIKRSLEYAGYKVKMARNYTDVGHLTSDDDEGEDKITLAARKEKLSPQEIADKYIKLFEADVKELNCQEPKYKPRATGYIKEMKNMAQILLDKGFAYATDLAIYFDISKAKDYTKLSGQDLSKNMAEAGKGEITDSQKKNPADFALWFFKAGAHQKAVQTWTAKFKLPDGQVIKKEGFPGWHLECSAMNRSLFGPTIDLHMGGIEHIPVHHTNEIAQSEAVSGVKFVSYWLHNEHLTVDGEKMSKSSGTAYSLSDLKNKGYDPLVLRYLFLQAHYRSKQNFTWEALEASKVALNNLQNVIARSMATKQSHGKINTKFKDKFIGAISDDFNVPQALALVWEVVKSDLSDGDKLSTILDFDKVLGLGLDKIKIEKIPQEVKQLAGQRLEARNNKNWAESDQLREKIAGLGYSVEDEKDGYKLKKK